MPRQFYKSRPTPMNNNFTKGKTMNGFIVDSNKDMGMLLWDDYTSSKGMSGIVDELQAGAEKLASSFISGQVTNLSNKLNPPLPSAPQVTYVQQPSTNTIQNIEEPMPKWLKYTLIGTGATVGILLLVTLGRMAFKKN